MIVTEKTEVLFKRAAFRHLIEHGISTEDELLFVFKEIFGVNIPTEVCCENHQPLWGAVTDDFFHRVKKQAIRHCRGGGKTFQVGTTKAAKLLAYPGLRISNFAATEQQSQALIGYVHHILGANSDPEVQRLVAELYGSVVSTHPRPVPGRTKDEGSVMKTLVGTLKGVNSSHVEDLVVDERAQMDNAVFKESMGMMTARPPYPGVLTVLSTVKQLGDPMDELLENADERGYVTYISCILDVMTCHEKNCEGCKKVYARSADNKTKESFYSFCQGRMLGRELGHFTVGTAHNKFTEMGLENAKAQLFCLIPEGEATAFPQFERERNVVPYTGPENDSFFVFGDFGKRDDSAWIKAYFVTHNGHRALHLTDEMIGKGKTIQEWIPMLKSAGWGDGQAFLVDIAGLQTTVTSKKSAIEYLTDEGWVVLYEKCDELETTERVRDLVKDTRILVDPKCKKVIEAFERATNQSVGTGDNKILMRIIRHNKYSHPVDSIRYGVRILMPDDGVEPPARVKFKGR